MTEEEAKTNWCPMAHAELAISNRTPGGNIPPWAHCVGSACMMWRTDPGFEEQITQGDQGCPTGEGWMAVETGVYVTLWRRPKRGGFCGLAGKP